MSTLKEYKLVGVSRHKGKFKVRYTNDKRRGVKLAKNGHTDILFVEMEDAGLKEDCIDRLLDADMPNSEMMSAVKDEARELGFIV